MREIAFDNPLCFPFRVYRPSRLVYNARRRRAALGMSGTIVLYAPLFLML